jgi:hypothetical protein
MSINIFSEEARHPSMHTYDWGSMVSGWCALMPVTVNVDTLNRGVVQKRATNVEIEYLGVNEAGNSDMYVLKFALEDVVYGPRRKGEVIPETIFRQTIVDSARAMQNQVFVGGSKTEWFFMSDLLAKMHPWKPTVAPAPAPAPVEEEKRKPASKRTRSQANDNDNDDDDEEDFKKEFYHLRRAFNYVQEESCNSAMTLDKVLERLEEAENQLADFRRAFSFLSKQ